MKTVFTLILLVTIVSCKKDSTPKPIEPKISSTTTKCVADQGTRRIEFTVNITTGVPLQKLELFKSPATKVSELGTPQTGMYTMYQMVTACPVQADNAMYYFVFTKTDGTQVTTTPFQVYF